MIAGLPYLDTDVWEFVGVFLKLILAGKDHIPLQYEKKSKSLQKLPVKCDNGGTTAAAPPPFRPSDPALCGSRPLVTPYYCRLGDLLCLFCVYHFVCALLSTYICI